MDVAQSAAVRILDWLHQAERDLVGKSVSTFFRRERSRHRLAA